MEYYDSCVSLGSILILFPIYYFFSIQPRAYSLPESIREVLDLDASYDFYIFYLDDFFKNSLIMFFINK